MEEEVDVTTVEEWIEGKQLKSSEDGGVDQQISDSQPSESRLTDSQLMSSKLAIAQSTKSKPSFLQCTNSKLTFLNRDSNMTENHTESHLPNSELANSQHTSSNPTDTQATDTQTTDMQTTDTQTTNSNLPLLQPDSNIAESHNTNSELAESVLSNTYSKFTNEQNIPRMEPDIMDSIHNTVSLSRSKDQNDFNNMIFVGQETERPGYSQTLIFIKQNCSMNVICFLKLSFHLKVEVKIYFLHGGEFNQSKKALIKLFSIVMFANSDHCNNDKNDLPSQLF